MDDALGNHKYVIYMKKGASPLGTPSGGGVYLTVYPFSRPNKDTVHFIFL